MCGKKKNSHLIFMYWHQRDHLPEPEIVQLCTTSPPVCSKHNDKLVRSVCCTYISLTSELQGHFVCEGFTSFATCLAVTKAPSSTQ